ncbi:MAG TPA: thioredoxin domain-containing protein [Steroidobacteraceae bacterium]|nr:thioredoxin domain-containing protein [Steroidobacteraceae bacterium]
MSAAPLACSLALCPGAASAVPAPAPAEPASAAVAIVGGQFLPYSALQAAVKVKLQSLDQQRDAEIRQISSETARERAAYIDSQLNSLIDQKVLALEAAANKTTPKALLAALAVPQVSEAQMQAFYQAQKAQIGRPYAQIQPQIKEFLQSAAADKARRRYYDSLRQKYHAKVLLGPMRERVDPTGPVRGPAKAPITIIEFSDFQCPFCGRLEPELRKLLQAYPTQLRLVYRNLPLVSLHPNAMHAAEAGVCADQQGKFWQMHDLMFADQGALSVPALEVKAKRIGLDMRRFDTCLDSGAALPVIKTDEQAAVELGLAGTPSTFINGRFLNGAVSYDELSTVVKDELRRLSAAGGRH